MQHRSKVLLSFGLCLSLQAVADASLSFTSQVGSGLVNGQPTKIETYSSGSDPAGLQAATSFHSLYDSGASSTDVFGTPARGGAAVQGGANLTAGALKLLAHADWVPNASVPVLPAGAVFAFGSATYMDSITFDRPGAAADSFVIGTLRLPVSATISFQPTAPSGTALGTLGVSLSMAFSSATHAGSGSGTILDTCRREGCTSTLTNLSAPSEGIVATLAPRATLDGVDLITLAFPIWGDHQVLQLNLSLGASAQNGVTVDALHTAVLSLQTPAGVDWKSESGFLSPVPEPASVTLMLAGLAATATRRRRRG